VNNTLISVPRYGQITVGKLRNIFSYLSYTRCVYGY